MPIPGYKLFTDLNFSDIKLEREIARINAVKKTGGAKTHTLTENEMPSHSHDISETTELVGEWGGGNDTYASGIVSYLRNANAQDGNKYAQRRFKIDANHDHTASNTGNSQAHNNLQPYITVYMWERTA